MRPCELRLLQTLKNLNEELEKNGPQTYIVNHIDGEYLIDSEWGSHRPEPQDTPQSLILLRPVTANTAVIKRRKIKLIGKIWLHLFAELEKTKLSRFPSDCSNAMEPKIKTKNMTATTIRFGGLPLFAIMKPCTRNTGTNTDHNRTAG